MGCQHDARVTDGSRERHQPDDICCHTAAVVWLMARLQASSRWGGIGTVALIYLLTHVAFCLAALLASYMLPEAPAQAARVDVNGRLPLAMHCRWDAIHYHTVSNDGYDDDGTPAFFPLFPLLLRIVGTILGGFRSPAALPIQEAERWPLIAGVLIANLAAFAAFFLLYRLAREALGDRDTATRSLLNAAVYP